VLLGDPLPPRWLTLAPPNAKIRALRKNAPLGKKG
jgi:hypothetical protein